jgi:two-component system KDP operon response regulator KdpE
MAAQVQVFPSSVKKQGLRVLLVSDETFMQDVLYSALESAGYDLHPVWSGKEALRTYQFARPDLVLLNLCLPDMDGKQLIKGLRKWTTAPIIVMSVRHEESEKIECLDTGADDYIVRPFAMGELLARLRAALRRAFGIPRSEVFTSGNLRVDFSRRDVFIGELLIKLTATEYDLLKVLASHADLVMTHYQLIHEIWGSTQYQDAMHLLRVTVSNLRRKLAIESGALRHIVTELGVGYRLRSNAD